MLVLFNQIRIAIFQFIKLLDVVKVFLLKGFFEFESLFGENVEALWLVSELELVEDVVELGVVFLEVLDDKFELFLSLNDILLELSSLNALILCLEVFLLGYFL